MSFDNLLDEARCLQLVAARKQYEEDDMFPAPITDYEDFPDDIKSEFDDIPSLFIQFYGMPDPASIDYAVESVGKVVESLATGEVDEATGKATYGNSDLAASIGFAQAKLEKWHGPAAQKCWREYFLRFPVIAQNHYCMASGTSI